MFCFKFQRREAEGEQRHIRTWRTFLETGLCACFTSCSTVKLMFPAQFPKSGCSSLLRKPLQSSSAWAWSSFLQITSGHRVNCGRGAESSSWQSLLLCLISWDFMTFLTQLHVSLQRLIASILEFLGGSIVQVLGSPLKYFFWSCHLQQGFARVVRHLKTSTTD